MPLGEFDHIEGRRFPWPISERIEPLMLQDDNFIRRGPLGDGIHLRNVAAGVRFKFPDHHHGAVAHAAIEFLKAEVRQCRALARRPIGAVGKRFYGPHHAVVFQAKLFGRVGALVV